MCIRWRCALVILIALAAAPSRGSDPGRPEGPRQRHPAAPTTPWQWRENGQPVRDETWRRSDGPFGAMLLLTDQPEEFLEAWARPPSADYVPPIHTVREARRGGVVAAMILFARCTPDPKGRCQTDVSFRVLRPDGSIYAEHRGVPLWNEPPPPVESLQLGQSHMGFEVELDDPLGKYQIHGLVRDRVSGREVSLTQELRIVDVERR